MILYKKIFDIKKIRKILKNYLIGYMLLILTILVHASKRSYDGEISIGTPKKQKLNTNEIANITTYEKNESNLNQLQFTSNNNDLRLFNQQIDTFDNNFSQNELRNTFERFDNFFESNNLQEEDLSFSIGTIFGNLIDSVSISTNDELSKQSNLELENNFMEKPSELSLSSSDDQIISRFLEKKSESTESSLIENEDESFSNSTNKIQKYELQCENYKTQSKNDKLQSENNKFYCENNKFYCENHLEKLKNKIDSFFKEVPEETIIKMQSKMESAKKLQIPTYLNYKIKDKNFNIHNFNGNLTNIREIIEPLEKKINISFRNIYYVFTGKYPIYKKIKNDIEFKKELYEKNTDFLKKYIFYNKLFVLEELEIKTDFHYFHRAPLNYIFKEYEKLNKFYREDLKLNKISKLRNYNLLSKEIYQCNKKYMIEYMIVWLNSVLNNETNFLIVELFPEILIFFEHLKESISILKTYKKIILLISLLIFKFHLMIFDLKNELNFNNLITDSKLINLFILDMRLIMFNIGLMFLQPKLTIKLGVKAFLAYVRIVQPGTLKHFLIDDFLEINDLFYDEVFKNVQMVASKKRKTSKNKGPFEMYTFVNLPTKLVKFKYRKMESYEKAKLYLEWSGKENTNVEVILNYKNHLTGRLRTFLLK